MVKIELTNENIPEEVIAEASKFGSSFEISKLPRDIYVVAKSGGYYICEGIKVSDELCKVRIIKLVGDFLTHPRSGKLKLQPFFDSQMNQYTLTGIDGGGWRPKVIGTGYDELETRTTYPLQDNDKGTWIVTSDDASIEWSADENYGNCYWTNGTDTLSWKGPPNGFSISGMYNIPGLSQVETSSDTGTSLYTTFGVYIYQDGGILCHGPQWFVNDEMKTLVAGAMYINGVLCCLAVTNKSPGFTLQLWSTKDTGVTWVLNGEAVVETRLRLSAQINKTGLSFVYDGKLYAIQEDLSGFSQTETVPKNTNGYRDIVGTGGYGSTYKYTGNKIIWSGMGVSEKLAYTSLNVDAFFDYTKNGSGGFQKKEQPVYRGNPATDIIVKQYGTYANNEIVFIAETNGNYCEIVWSGVDRSEGKFGFKTTTLCNSDYSVTATANPQGVSYTLERTAEPNDIVISGDLGIAGTRGPIDTQYTVSNAIGDVMWSNSQGTIGSTGLAIFTGCGTAIITATDQCGRSASINVALASGRWVNNASFTPIGGPSACLPSYCFSGGGYANVIVGNKKYSTCFCQFSFPSAAACEAPTLGCSDQTPELAAVNSFLGYSPNCVGNVCNYFSAVYSEDVWSCP